MASNRAGEVRQEEPSESTTGSGGARFAASLEVHSPLRSIESSTRELSDGADVELNQEESSESTTVS